MEKKYLGGGVYFDFDGHRVILSTENGSTVMNRMHFEPVVIEAISISYKELKKELKERKVKPGGYFGK